MNLPEAKQKYNGKMLRHKTKPFVLFAVSFYSFEGEIKVAFQHPYYHYIPKGQPLNTTVSDLEDNWDILEKAKKP
ncbi:hypothetical protein [Aurantibacillus circumpalustris]|uniref:hypothetical protein n=1 Tax=Aurantibacillus circumpalustris TaxID=3036359 RepID=UPI00295A9CB6|nr:hypothetical protein [Aurantibacillus circumpalustris]